MLTRESARSNDTLCISFEDNTGFVFCASEEIVSVSASLPVWILNHGETRYYQSCKLVHDPLLCDPTLGVLIMED